jgi:hypothetical protein
MALYFLDYDLHKKHEFDYQRLWNELERLDAVRILESLWCFNRAQTDPPNLRDHFRQFVHRDDSLCVSEVVNWATINTLSTPKELLARR